ncbi:MAG: SAVED domain-containing protein [Anaerolineae bacterium]|nr:SAVED domain-containing protein [Anaerolineae bacterium]
MSRTKLGTREQIEVWLRAGGRCEYRGCNQPLWKDSLTLTAMNAAYLAHIIADKPTGPRGDPVLSEKLKADLSNIMLLCDVHHRLVDIEDVEGHPVERLREYKKEHEQRIERQTAIHPNRPTHIVLFGTRIGDRAGLVNYEQACEAVLPERYPADECGIRLDLAGNEVSESDPEFWSQTAKYVERHLQRYLAAGVGPTGKRLNHLSIFALAPIPVLIHFGRQLGDVLAADVYQYHRATSDWRWKPLDNQDFDYVVRRPRPDDRLTSRIAVNLSLSGRIHPGEIEKAVGQALPTYVMTIAHPRRDFLCAAEQLELFRNEWYKLVAEIRDAHGPDCEIHLFPAVPCSVAVEMGRALLPKTDPHFVVYDNDKQRGGFDRCLDL